MMKFQARHRHSRHIPKQHAVPTDLDGVEMRHSLRIRRLPTGFEINDLPAWTHQIGPSPFLFPPFRLVLEDCCGIEAE